MAGNREIEGLLAGEDHEGLVELARSGKVARVLRYLTGRLCSGDEQEKWRAVRGLGALMAEPGLVPQSKAVNQLRQYFWALNDESGAVPFGMPEAIGEILARRPGLQDEFLPILASMLTHEDMIQTGAIERGVMWGLGRVGEPVVAREPMAVKALKHAVWSHPEEATRIVAGEALARICPPPE